LGCQGVNQQVGQANVNGTKLRQLGIPIMPSEEQVEIARHIESAFNWIDRLASEATSARKLIDHLDQAVLAKGFRGELVPQDPSDEPASVLLERISAERATAPARAKGAKRTPRTPRQAKAATRTPRTSRRAKSR
jgi:type I restriction enzyme, S subunit